MMSVVRIPASPSDRTMSSSFMVRPRRLMPLSMCRPTGGLSGKAGRAAFIALIWTGEDSTG